jgi:hypothetical protein
VAIVSDGTNYQTTSGGSSVLGAGYCTSILSFGGSGNSSSDNTTALNNALASLTGTGGCIYFPPGKYKFLSAISYSLASPIFSVGIVGGGQDNTILTWPNASGGITLNYTSALNTAHVRDLSLTTGTTAGGNALTLTSATSQGVAVSDIYRVTIRGDDGYGITDYWSTGVHAHGISNLNGKACWCREQEQPEPAL